MKIIKDIQRDNIYVPELVGLVIIQVNRDFFFNFQFTTIVSQLVGVD